MGRTYIVTARGIFDDPTRDRDRTRLTERSTECAQAKLRHFRAAGTQFVALIDPYRKIIWVDGEPPNGFDVDFKLFLT
jgi:hypothetical protein